MTEGLFSTVDLGAGDRAGYRLRQVEVFNWGTFDRQVWRLRPNCDTALLTGDIGSGKSTLVDAVTTLLMPAHKIAYNKAAGAESRERTLRSYVEGHYKSERIEASGRSRAIGLRSGGRTYSVVLGVFANEGYDEIVTLAQVFQQRDTAGQPYRFFVTATKELSIAVDFADFGSDLRDLRKRLRAAGAELFDEFPRYATSMRRLLGIRSEQALELFHQTVSMKSVGNLNDFVRDHMLEPSDATGRVREIIAHFEDLTKAHDAVKRAREQLEILDPIASTTAKYDAVLAERERLEQQRSAVRLYIAELRSQLLTAEIESLRLDEQRWDRERAGAKARSQALRTARESLIEERARSGGDRIGELERLARDAREQADKRRVTRARFDAALVEADLEPISDSSAFADLAALVTERRQALAQQKRADDTAYADAIGHHKQLQAKARAVGAELASLEHRTSNLPVEQVEIREQLCAAVGIPAEELPFAGELIDVADAHSDWRGAAERVLRGFALSLLVPQRHYDAVSAWVNTHPLTFRGRDGRPAGGRLVYERVPVRLVALQPSTRDGQTLADCLELKDGPFISYLQMELTKRADHRCALTLDEFRHERRAVTREGQVRSGERHEKDDRHRVNDPRRWVLGWANERKIEALRSELSVLQREADQAAGQIEALGAQRDALQQQLEAFARLEGFDNWTDLDVDEAVQRAAGHESERARLEAGSSRLREISDALEHNEQQAQAVSTELDAITGKLATIRDAADRARAAQARADGEVAECPPDELARARESYPALDARLANARPVQSAECAAVETVLTADLHRGIEKAGKELSRYVGSLLQGMAEVLRRWPELRADVDAAIESRHEFVMIRQRVATDDLPRFETEFKHQLNKNAIQELAGFNNWLNRQAAAIDERVARINEALGAVPYNPGRYIRLERQPTNNSDVVQFRSDLRNLTNDSLAIDGEQYSEQRFIDVKQIIERLRGRENYAEADKNWTRRVTDVRNWFVFSASERDLATDEEWEHYSDSDGKSGGQKEKLAYTILAASLAYQFGLEWGVRRSKDFRFAVIDEAFGRGSDASTRYALELFAKLGLQLLIVTPLQKVHVIEPYVKNIGYVDNPTGSCSRLYTMTIEEYRERRDGQSA